jgi:hypothetical protein
LFNRRYRDIYYDDLERYGGDDIAALDVQDKFENEAERRFTPAAPV